MRRRRVSPYSRIEEIRRSRKDLLSLVVLTLCLGAFFGLFTGLLSDDLSYLLPDRFWRYVLTGSLSLVFTLLALALFHSTGESQRVEIEIHLPYRLPPEGRPEIIGRESYRVIRHARRAFMRRYQDGSSELESFHRARQETQKAGKRFQQFIASPNAELVQCLVLYVLHLYSDQSIGPDAEYGWWKVDLPATRLSMDELPPPLRDNPFLRADQKAEEWRLYIPAGVQLELQPEKDNPFPRWRLKHRLYGYVEISWQPELTLAGEGSQEYRMLTQPLTSSEKEHLHVVSTRMEAVARFRLTFWPGVDNFHDWAVGFLSFLEEALDWGYYLAARSDLILTRLDWKVGWIQEGSSLAEMLRAIEGRLEAVERMLEKPSSTREEATVSRSKNKG